MPAPPDDAVPRSDGLAPASSRTRQRLGLALLAVTVLAVLLVAGGAPAEVRAPFVLLSATLLPGYPLVVRFPVDLPTLLALDLCVSLALEAALTFLLVQVDFWHPQALGLALAGVGVSATIVAVTALRDAPP